MRKTSRAKQNETELEGIKVCRLDKTK